MTIKKSDSVWINKNTVNNSDIFPIQTEVVKITPLFYDEPDAYLVKYNAYLLYDEDQQLDWYDLCYKSNEVFLTREECVADLLARLKLRKEKAQAKIVEMDEFINLLKTV